MVDIDLWLFFCFVGIDGWFVVGVDGGVFCVVVFK